MSKRGHFKTSRSTRLHKLRCFTTLIHPLFVPTNHTHHCAHEVVGLLVVEFRQPINVRVDFCQPPRKHAVTHFHAVTFDRQMILQCSQTLNCTALHCTALNNKRTPRPTSFRHTASCICATLIFCMCTPSAPQRTAQHYYFMDTRFWYQN